MQVLDFQKEFNCFIESACDNVLYLGITCFSCIQNQLLY